MNEYHQDSIDKEVLLVAGYIRNIDIKKIIPDVIKDEIYKYQKLMYDKWDKKYSHQDMIIDDDGTNDVSILTYSTVNALRAYGSQVIDHGIFTWKIKIISTGDWNPYSTEANIGIIEDNEKVLTQDQEDEDWFETEHGYQFDSGNGAVYTSNKFAEIIRGASKYQREFKSNDIFEMTLNLEERTLSFNINKCGSWTAVRNIAKVNYRLIMTNYHREGAQFALIHQC